MYIQLLQRKLTAIKEASPTINDFLINGFDLKYASDILNLYKFEFEGNTDYSVSNLFELYRMSVKCNSFSVFGLSLSEVQEYDEFYQIGSRESDPIILLKSTNEVAILDIENYEIIYYISKDFEMFLDLLPILILYDKIGYLGQKYNLEIKNITLEKIINLLVDAKYYTFFSFSINGR